MNLLEQVIATAGGSELWRTLRALRVDMSIGGPIWAMKGWPPGPSFDQIVTLRDAVLLFASPGVGLRELEPWHEAGQTWRRLAVRFPPAVATDDPEQVFYFDASGVQGRMDYIVEVNGSTLVGP